MVRPTSGVVSRAAQRVAVIGVKLQAPAVAPITSAVADGGNRAVIRQNVGGSTDNPIEEVIHSNHSNNDLRGFPVITGRLELMVNRQ